MRPDINDFVLHSQGGKFADNTNSKLADVKRLLTNAKAKDHVVIHLHGGLVSKDSAYGVADSLVDLYQSAGAYPVFFVWESSVVEALRNNVGDVIKDPAFRELVKKVSEWVLKKTGGNGVAVRGDDGTLIDEQTLRRKYDQWFDGNRTAPPVSDDSDDAEEFKTRGGGTPTEGELATDIEQGLDADPDFKKAMEEAYNKDIPAGDMATKGAGTKNAATVCLLSESAQLEMFNGVRGVTTRGLFSWPSVALFVAKVVIAVLKRMHSSRDHGTYCTIIEEVLRRAYGGLIGGGIWNQMKKDTGDSFGDDLSCCGAEVVRQLKTMQDANAGIKRLTLVGHSTGAIYVCNFLDAAEKVGLTVPIKIVFLAPAVTCARFAQAVAKHAGTSRIDSFRMFAMDDQRESEDKMLSIVYTRSLLYFVSGLLEGDAAADGEWKDEIDMPLVGMKRFLDLANVFDKAEFPAVAEVAAFLDAGPNRKVWSIAEGGPGLNSTSRKHGNFDNGDPPTQDSVKVFMQ